MQEPLTVWSDEADLLRRAATPQVEWFPVPRRAGVAMQPLIWLLALVPILFAGVQGSWTEDAARWGLRSLKLLSADDWSDLLDPGDAIPDGALTYEPPLMTWLTTASIWCAGPAQPSAVIFPAALCVFLIVVMSYELAWRIGGAWLGMLTTLLVATHPVAQQLVRQPTATTMGLAMSLTTLWCLLSHLESGGATWSRWLVPGGICWGLCLMSSGPLSLVTVMIVVLFLATAPKSSSTGRRIIHLARKNSTADWKHWKSLIIWLAIGCLVGGWWPLMMGSLHGGDFWPVWLGLTTLSDPNAILTRDVESWVEGSKIWFRHSAAMLPLLTGFVFLGGYRMLRIVIRNEEPPLRRGQHFLLVWTAVALGLWMLSVLGLELALFQRSLWTAFLLIPLAMLAAGGLLEIGERHAGFGTTLAAYALGVLVAVWRYRGDWLDPAKLTHQMALIIGLGILFGFCLWLTRRFIQGHDTRQLWLVRGGIWGLLIAHCVWGANFLSSGPLAANGLREQPLLQFWGDLRNVRTGQPTGSNQGGELILITTLEPSSRLIYVVQSIWPRRTLKISTSWDSVTPRRPAAPSRIIVTHGKREIIRPSKPGDSAALVPIVPPRIYLQAELTAYDLQE